MDIGSNAQNDSGLGDIQLAYGYFLPVDWADLLPVIQVKFPTGPFDKNRSTNYGSGYTDIWLEFFLNKRVEKFMLDFVTRYWIKFENTENNYYKLGL